MRLDRAEERLGVPDRVDDVEAVVPEEPQQALAQEDGVLREDDAQPPGRVVGGRGGAHGVLLEGSGAAKG